MSGEGQLTDRDITEIVQDLSRRSWTGLLRLERAGYRVGVTVVEGRLVFASSSNLDHRQSYLAGTDDDRLAGLSELLDAGVSTMIAARGGAIGIHVAYGVYPGSVNPRISDTVQIGNSAAADKRHV